MEEGQQRSTQALQSATDESDPLLQQTQNLQVQRTYKLGFVIQLVSLATIGGFLFGYDTGVIAGAQLYFVDTWPTITDQQRGLIVSLAMAGAAVGALFAGPLSDKIGRKPVILIADTFFTAGAILMAAAPEIWVLMLGRIIVGVGVGIATQVVPVYLGEISPPQIRGRLIATNNLMTCLAQFIATIFAFLLSPHWRIMLGLAGVPSFVQFCGMLFMPESPRWLSKQGQVEKSRGVMTMIYEKVFVEDAVQHLQGEVDELKQETNMTEGDRLKSLFTTFKKCLLIGCSLQAFQQLVGINTAMYYGPDILISAGVTIPGLSQDQAALLLNMPLAFVNTVGSALSIIFIDSLGRRYLMLRTLPFTMLAWIITATGMYYSGYTTATLAGTIMAFSGIVIFLFSFSLGMSSTPWTVNAEIYPLHVIGTANSLATTTNWLTNFLVSTYFLLLLDSNLGSILAFVALAFFAVCAWIFIYCLLPETAGKHIDVILAEILGTVPKKDHQILMDEERDSEIDVSKNGEQTKPYKMI